MFAVDACFGVNHERLWCSLESKLLPRRRGDGTGSGAEGRDRGEGGGAGAEAEAGGGAEGRGCDEGGGAGAEAEAGSETKGGVEGGGRAKGGRKRRRFRRKPRGDHVAWVALRAEVVRHHQVRGTRGEAVGGARRARGACPRRATSMLVPFASRPMPRAHVPVDVGTEGAVALARFALPQALADLGIEVFLRDHEDGVVGGGGRGIRDLLRGRFPRRLARLPAERAFRTPQALLQYMVWCNV